MACLITVLPDSDSSTTKPYYIHSRQRGNICECWHKFTEGRGQAIPFSVSLKRVEEQEKEAGIKSTDTVLENWTLFHILPHNSDP